MTIVSPSTVWVLHDLPFDLSKASEWGMLRAINHRYIFADEVGGTEIPPAFIENMRLAALIFGPRDFLLLSGDYLQIAAFSTMLGQRFQSYNVLRWDKVGQSYLQVTIRRVLGL